MELTGLFPIVKRWLVVIVMATAMAAVVGAVLGASAEKTYEAKAELLVGPLSTDTDTMRASGALAQTYAELATSGTVLDPVSESLDVSSGDLKTGVRVTANSTTRFMQVRARAHHPKAAADIANAVADQLIGLSREGTVRPEGQLRVLDPAEAPSTPMSPRLNLIVPLAAVAGLLGSLTLVLLFEYVGDTAESADKVSAATGTITIPVRRGRPRGSSSGSSRRADPLHVVATQVELAGPEVRTVVLTGVADLDGTGGLVLDLAETWAERHDRVVVVDAGAGEISEILGLGDRPGLGEVLDPDPDTAGIEVELIEIAPRVFLIPRGAGRTEAVRAEQASTVLAQLSHDHGLVVFHAPSAATSAGTLVWSSVADVTVVVARRFHARRAAINEVAVNLRAVQARLAFAVLHDAPRSAALQAWRQRVEAAPPRVEGAVISSTNRPTTATATATADQNATAPDQNGTGTSPVTAPARNGSGRTSAGTKGKGRSRGTATTARNRSTGTTTTNGNGNGNGNGTGTGTGTGTGKAASTSARQQSTARDSDS